MKDSWWREQVWCWTCCGAWDGNKAQQLAAGLGWGAAVYSLWPWRGVRNYWGAHMHVRSLGCSTRQCSQRTPLFSLSRISSWMASLSLSLCTGGPGRHADTFLYYYQWWVADEEEYLLLRKKRREGLVIRVRGWRH
jgi:hypothetical protein